MQRLPVRAAERPGPGPSGGARVGGPIEGLVVVDLAWGMPTSVATMVLADYGAEVVKVERPRAGRDLT
ncbi:MAG: CoA transferase, partial [Acidimicrobiia bacterium]